MKIATLLPSATEIVAALGFTENLVGISHSCNFPPAILGLPRVTSTRIPVAAPSAEIDRSVRAHLANNTTLYDLDTSTLALLAPDVIVSQALCDVCAVATGDVTDALVSLPGAPELIDLTPNNLTDVYSDIRRVATTLGAPEKGAELVAEMQSRANAVAARTSDLAEANKPRVAFLEWLQPPFNGGHWNPELVELAGGVDILGRPGEASSTLNWAQVIAARPDVLFVACCGLDVERASEDLEALDKITAWRDLLAMTAGRVYLCDGNSYFSSPGPRLIDGLEVLAHALHPDRHPKPAGSDLRQIDIG